MEAQKIDFLKQRFVALLRQLPSGTQPGWGKMTLQQMVEHFTDFVNIAAGKSPFTTVVTPAEHLPRMQAFIQSDKPFRENTINILMPETPAPVRNATLEAALDELQTALDTFFATFEANPTLITLNPIFGELNFTLNVHLLYKHALHHLRQFGITINTEA